MLHKSLRAAAMTIFVRARKSKSVLRATSYLEDNLQFDTWRLRVPHLIRPRGWNHKTLLQVITHSFWLDVSYSQSPICLFHLSLLEESRNRALPLRLRKSL